MSLAQAENRHLPRRHLPHQPPERPSRPGRRQRPAALLRPLAFAALALLAACTATGTGDLRLSKLAAAGYQEFRRLPERDKAMAVTEDGKDYAIAYCSEASCTGGLRQRALAYCEQTRAQHGLTEAPCRLFAVGDAVLWQGTVEIPAPGAPVRYRFQPAAATLHKGPAASAGAVLYLPGNHPAHDLAADDWRVPTYLEQLGQGGWDVFKGITSNSELVGDTRTGMYRTLKTKLQALRRAGYPRVALAGDSWGGWASIEASGSADLGADAVIATAPARYGPRLIDGRRNPWFERNRSELAALLRGFHGRLMLVFFSDDEFDPGGRARQAAAILENRGLEHVVVDRPGGVRGHEGAWYAGFAHVFGACIEAFLAAERLPAGFGCPAGGAPDQAIAPAPARPAWAAAPAMPYERADDAPGAAAGTLEASGSAREAP